MYGVKGRRSRKANENYYNALAELRQFGRKVDNHVKEMKAYVQEMHNNSVYAQRDGLPERAQKFLKQEVGLDKRIKIFKDFRYQLSDMELQLKSGQTMANFADVGIMFSKTLQDKRLKQIFNPEFQRNLSSIMDQQTENIDKLSQMIEAFDSVVSTGIGHSKEFYFFDQFLFLFHAANALPWYANWAGINCSKDFIPKFLAHFGR